MKETTKPNLGERGTTAYLFDIFTGLEGMREKQM